MTAALGEACASAMHVVTRGGETLRAGRAVLFVARQLGWRRLAWLGGRPPLIWLVELGYRLVARHRRLLARLL